MPTVWPDNALGGGNQCVLVCDRTGRGTTPFPEFPFNEGFDADPDDDY